MTDQNQVVSDDDAVLDSVAGGAVAVEWRQENLRDVNEGRSEQMTWEKSLCLDLSGSAQHIHDWGVFLEES